MRPTIAAGFCLFLALGASAVANERMRNSANTLTAVVALQEECGYHITSKGMRAVRDILKEGYGENWVSYAAAMSVLHEGIHLRKSAAERTQECHEFRYIAGIVNE